jgi:hypothetical protein
MRAKKVSSQVAWSEREAKLRSAKRSAAVVVATLAALLISSNFHLYGAQQTDIQRAMQARAVQRRAARARAQAHAQELLKRDWKDWTASDCVLVLTYSPWTNGDLQSWISGTVQLRSARPIREALLRQLQSKKRYDTMSPQQKLSFDKKNPTGMNESENDSILLYVEHDGIGDIAPDQAQQTALELTDGTLVMPSKTESLQYDADKDRILYSFPRVINGQPVLTANDQKLNFVFGKPLVRAGRVLPLQNPQSFKIHEYKLVPGPAKGQKVLLNDGLLTSISFRAAELMHNGKLEY